MKLNRDIRYYTRYSDNGAHATICDGLALKLPSVECTMLPSILVVLYNGEYYVVKTRMEIEGDPYNLGSSPVNPYDLEFDKYTLQEFRAKSHDNDTKYSLWNDIIGKNVLICV